MSLKIEYAILVITVIIINLFSIDIYSDSPKKIIKVGAYNDSAYMRIDENNNVSGYYVDLLELLKKNFEDEYEYEYVLCDFKEGLDMLESGEIDIIIGVNMNNKRKGRFIFNKYLVGSEKYGIYSKKNIKYGDLKAIDKTSLGLLESNASSDWIYNFLKNRSIKNDIVLESSISKLEELLKNDKVDFIVGNRLLDDKYNLIYKFSLDNIHIAGNKERADLINLLDNSIMKYSKEKHNPILFLYNKHFKKNKDIEILKLIIFIIISIIIIPKLRKLIIKNKIRKRIKNNTYTLYYQPIYKVENKYLSGFEALIRLKRKNGEVLSPFKFMKEIEESNMALEISIWVLEKVIEDYSTIKSELNENIDFYLSMNLSLNEIVNESFIEKAIDILNRSKIGKDKICLEIIETVKVSDLDITNKSIERLKYGGFKIAVDDFGVEYANLDILEKLDYDMVKLDKYFIDDIINSSIKEEIIMFMVKISELYNKNIIIEGVEEKSQEGLIKLIEGRNVYVQGYLYNKPMPIEMIVQNTRS